MWKEFDKSNKYAVMEMELFIRAHKKGHFMQMPYWGEVKTLWQWHGISVYRQDRLVATMGILIRKLPLGFSMFYVPRGPVCDRTNPNIWGELMEAMKQVAKKHHALLVHTDPDEHDSNEEFRTLMKSLGFREKKDDGFGNIQPQHVFRLNLTEGSKDIFKTFSAKTRYNIRLAQRKGIVIREYSGSDRIPDFVLKDFHCLMKTTGQRDHFCIRGLPYFRGLLNALKDDSRIFVAYLCEHPIAGSIEVFCGKKAWYLYGASANEHRNVMPNYLLQWTMIQRAIERDCEVYDFRGVPGGNTSEDDPLYGLYRFKKGFSGEYTKFTGLFTYRFHPLLSCLLQTGIGLRQIILSKIQKKNGNYINRLFYRR